MEKEEDNDSFDESSDDDSAKEATTSRTLQFTLNVKKGHSIPAGMLIVGADQNGNCKTTTNKKTDNKKQDDRQQW